jgi:hypothetical protein
MYIFLQDLVMKSRLASNSGPSWLSLLSAGIIVVHHHNWLGTSKNFEVQGEKCT